MTHDERSDPGAGSLLDKRRVRIGLFVLGLCIGLMGMAIAANLTLTTDSYQVGDGLVLNASNGPAIELDENVTVDRVYPVDGNAVNLQPPLLVTGAAGTRATVRNLSPSDTWFDADSIDASPGVITFDPEGKPTVGVGGGVTRLQFADYTLDDGQADLILDTTGASTLTLHGLGGAGDFLQVVDNTTGTVVNTTPIANGEATATISSSGTYDLQTDDAAITNPDPSDGAGLSSLQAVDLSVHVDHPAFDTGDQVDVAFYDASDDSLIGTNSTSSAGRVSTTWGDPDLGTNEWYVETSFAGRTNQSSTWSFNTPAELSIYNETSPTELVDEVSVTLRFYFNGDQDLIVNRTTSDGQINMTGLPTDRTFVVDAQADGYHPRRIYVDSLFETQTVYLLPANASAVETVFEIQDYTGQYPQDVTAMEIQRAINGSWGTVEGDFFGATGTFSATLEQNVRHRLIIHNTVEDRTRVLGHYIPLASGTRTVTINPDWSISINGVGAAVRVSPDIRQLPATANATVSLDVGPTHGNLQEWNVTIELDENGSRSTLFQVNGTEPTGTSVTQSLDLSSVSDPENTTVVASANWTHAEGFAGYQSVSFQVSNAGPNPFSLVASIEAFYDAVSEGSQAVFAAVLGLIVVILGTAYVSTMFPMGTEELGLVALGLFIGGALLGWLPWAAVFAAAAGFIAFAAIRRGL